MVLVNKLLLASSAALLSCASSAQFGVDLSVLTSTDQWDCLARTGNTTFGIVRVYRSLGALDDNAAATIHSAFSAGLRDMHAYIFPCISSSSYAISNGITCDSPADQMKQSIEYLESNNIHVHRYTEDPMSKPSEIRRIWLDVEDEDPHKYYDSDPAVNQKALSEMIAEAESEAVSIGIYTTKTYWNNIMGGVEGYSQYPLWYPRYDGVNSMDFFEPFSGWTNVYIKQTAGDAGLCGISQVDTDYMELI